MSFDISCRTRRRQLGPLPVSVVHAARVGGKKSVLVMEAGELLDRIRQAPELQPFQLLLEAIKSNR